MSVVGFRSIACQSMGTSMAFQKFVFVFVLLNSGDVHTRSIISDPSKSTLQNSSVVDIPSQAPPILTTTILQDKTTIASTKPAATSSQVPSQRPSILEQNNVTLNPSVTITTVSGTSKSGIAPDTVTSKSEPPASILDRSLMGGPSNESATQFREQTSTPTPKPPAVGNSVLISTSVNPESNPSANRSAQGPIEGSTPTQYLQTENSSVVSESEAELGFIAEFVTSANISGTTALDNPTSANISATEALENLTSASVSVTEALGNVISANVSATEALENLTSASVSLTEGLESVILANVSVTEAFENATVELTTEPSVTEAEVTEAFENATAELTTEPSVTEAELTEAFENSTAELTTEPSVTEAEVTELDITVTEAVITEAPEIEETEPPTLAESLFEPTEAPEIEETEPVTVTEPAGATEMPEVEETEPPTAPEGGWENTGSPSEVSAVSNIDGVPLKAEAQNAIADLNAKKVQPRSADPGETEVEEL